MTKPSAIKFSRKSIGRKIHYTLRTRILPNRLNVLTFILFLMVIAVLAWVIYREREILAHYPWKFDPVSIVGVIGMHTLALCSLSYAWHHTIALLTGVRNWKLDLYVYSISVVARRIPTPIWSFGSRFYFYRGNVSATTIAVATGLELVFILIAGVFCYVLFLPFYSFSGHSLWIILTVLLLLAFLGFVFQPNWVLSLSNFILKAAKRPIIQFSFSRFQIFSLLGLYLLTWIADGFTLFFTITLLVPNVPGWADVLQASTISALVSIVTQFLPIAFASKEFALSGLLSVWLPLSAGLIIAIACRILMTLNELIIALIVSSVFSPYRTHRLHTDANRNFEETPQK